MTLAQDINLFKNTFEISVEDYYQTFADNKNHQLLDIREPWEIKIAHLENTITIPLRFLEEKKDRLSRDCWTIIYCHHGVRSLQACHLLREKGFDKVLSLKGGIHRWSQVINPDISIY